MLPILMVDEVFQQDGEPEKYFGADRVSNGGCNPADWLHPHTQAITQKQHHWGQSFYQSGDRA